MCKSWDFGQKKQPSSYLTYLCNQTFAEKTPYYSNPSEKIGLLSSMYILKKYRRKGFTKQLLSRDVREAKSYGCSVIQIDASEMGV